jgi:Protein of unknown function (DUF2892)
MTQEAIMTFINEADWDRGIRLIVGVVLFGAGTLFLTGWISTVLIGIGALALITGLAGWCPAYTVVGLSRRKITDARHRFQ